MLHSLAASLFITAMQNAQWRDLAPLPRDTSGQFAGVSHGALIVVGGSRFDKAPYDGGIKQWLDSVFVLEPDAQEWLTFHGPHAMAYGGSVTWRNSLVVAGGSDGRRNFREAYRVEWENGQPAFTPLPELPFPLANCEAELIGDRMYVFGGQQSPDTATASKALLSLDLSDPGKGWSQLDPLPGAGRILPVFAESGGDLYVFGGAELTSRGRVYLTDGWRWRSGSGWQSVAGPPFAMVAAPAVSSRERILVFGGDDGENANRVEELRDRHPGFSKDIYEFHASQQAWTKLGVLPVGLVTTSPVTWRQGVVIPGGEDRPGHRSARVISWNPQ
jgi:N-acetylneuraminic acid mutarotase